ncbi:bis-aminopropyl spermidine synthase family protein [Clostridium malenominatum]|uniref:Bis-aminopropyl spermidine synthase family protein n=1 Tax=Clostridium malenominatum TaxID=1539 RepID=A0ABP3TWH7_9CLOT
MNNKYEWDYLQQVSENVNIEDGKQCIEKVLINIYFKEGISTKELARNNLLPIPIITAIKKEFIKYGLLVQYKGIRLTTKGKSFMEDELGFKGLNKNLYAKLLSEPWEEHEEILDIKEEVSEIFIKRPQANVIIDQSKCTVDTAVRRAVLALTNSVLINKKILCIGDDDLVSIAIGFLLKKLFVDIKYCKTTICVMDIDERILNYIQGVADKENLPIKCYHTNFKLPLSKEFKEGFDCFFTDPPYTLQGMNLFMSRGIEALKKEKGMPIFLSYAHKSPEFDFTMQKSFINMGLMISKILSAFNSYEGAGIIGNTGQMIILKTTSKSKPLIESSYNGLIYTGEFKITVRQYKCKECGEITKVGISENIKTIEELKERGCGKCNTSIFKICEKTKIV